jgi:hypothetical protein
VDAQHFNILPKIGFRFDPPSRKGTTVTNRDAESLGWIDPPCGPYSAVAEIREWINELVEMRARFDDERSLRMISGCIEQAEKWIARRAPGSELK